MLQPKDTGVTLTRGSFRPVAAIEVDYVEALMEPGEGRS
jgi:hypothetical protein